MAEDPSTPTADRLLEGAAATLEGEPPAAALEALGDAPAADRKAVLRDLREHAEEHPEQLAPLLDPLTDLLTDDERAVRLSTVKLFGAVAEDEPASVAAVVPELADRLADEAEFYYVRARAAEALGYVALERPAAVAEPAILAELTVGLEFEEPEVRRKLAKALAHLAVGAPERLGHHVPRIAGRLDDGEELVRLYLCSALAAVACERPGAVGEAVEPAAGGTNALVARLDDEEPWVLGRAAETVGLLARADGATVAVEIEALPEDSALAERFEEEAVDFAAARVAFARAGLDESEAGDGVEVATSVRSSGGQDAVGTIEGIRATTEDAVAAITAPADACPSCGTARPPTGPPICPSCGGPF